ncbi:hypothetical protein [Cytobacillus purgationiresistens]|uniref:Uncharacterized protein n=1 Tax=Cytobacillus purgationiresistens TaxID=863449 RepID=A0ABU0ACS5_9BACI|nr:hypothetical protein [Cytobacillus purgationiresistens]MDQ0268684.1 hypothetical protein [Cytobacillus purgationiresistens]
MKDRLSGYLDQIEKSTFNYLVNDDETEVKIVTDCKKAILNVFDYMQQENESYKEALKFYADKEDYWGHGEASILHDEGEIARNALVNKR